MAKFLSGLRLTILTRIKKGMPVYDDEFFGAVAVIISAKNETEAIQIAHDGVFRFFGAVFSKAKREFKKLRKRN